MNLRAANPKSNALVYRMQSMNTPPAVIQKISYITVTRGAVLIQLLHRRRA